MPLSRERRRQLERDNARQPLFLAPVPRPEWPARADAEPNAIVRVSVNRPLARPGGGWDDGLTWDELMRVKREIGRADAWAVECYPPDKKVINVAAFRHLWLVPVELVPFAWGARP